MSRARVQPSQSSQVSQSQRRKVYHIFSGRAGRTDAYGQPDSLAHFFGPDVDVEEIDLLNDVDGSPSENDILDAAKASSDQSGTAKPFQIDSGAAKYGVDKTVRLDGVADIQVDRPSPRYRELRTFRTHTSGSTSC